MKAWGLYGNLRLFMQEDGRTDEAELASFHQTFIYGHSVKMMCELSEPLSSLHWHSALVRCAEKHTCTTQNQTKVSARNLQERWAYLDFAVKGKKKRRGDRKKQINGHEKSQNKVKSIWAADHFNEFQSNKGHAIKEGRRFIQMQFEKEIHTTPCPVTVWGRLNASISASCPNMLQAYIQK